MSSDKAKWYILHTYSGYENKVKNSIELTLENRPEYQDFIFEVQIPMEKIKEIKNNEEVEIERKLFPGYVLIKMIVNNDTWVLLRTIRGVTGFVGPEGKPVPLTDEELNKIGIQRERLEIPFNIGDNVKITDGTMKGFTGYIDSIDDQTGAIRVTVSMFGREMSVDFTVDKLEKVDF